MTAFYNEIDPYCAQWLRNLIDAGHIAPGIVDERSIEDIAPDELRGYSHCHFFAGLGGWAYAMELAGWPRDRPVWTGSCPCQPFSSAGKGHGFADERHLWPAWFHLIRECRPGVVFGEQVASAIAHGWLDLVQADMESSGYAIGPVCLPAAAVADHERERLWFVAHTDSSNAHEWSPSRKQPIRDESVAITGRSDVRRIRCSDGLVRAIESGVQPLAHGIPRRMDKFRAYGNAINPLIAAEFIVAADAALRDTAQQAAA